jgi:hypothetical protein
MWSVGQALCLFSSIPFIIPVFAAEPIHTIGGKEVAFTYIFHLVYINLASKIFVRVLVQEVQYTQRHPTYCSQEMRLFLLCMSVFKVLQMFYVSNTTFASFFTILVNTGTAVSDQQHISWTIHFPQ